LDSSVLTEIDEYLRPLMNELLSHLTKNLKKTLIEQFLAARVLIVKMVSTFIWPDLERPPPPVSTPNISSDELTAIEEEASIAYQAAIAPPALDSAPTRTLDSDWPVPSIPSDDTQMPAAPSLLMQKLRALTQRSSHPKLLYSVTSPPPNSHTNFVAIFDDGQFFCTCGFVQSAGLCCLHIFALLPVVVPGELVKIDISAFRHQVIAPIWSFPCGSAMNGLHL
jgi:hypothetical protein